MGVAAPRSPTRSAAWVEETDVDGFNLNHVVTPGSSSTSSTWSSPSCSGAGRYKTAYDEGTLRHKLFGRGARLPETHRAARYRRVDRQEATR